MILASNECAADGIEANSSGGNNHIAKKFLLVIMSLLCIALIGCGDSAKPEETAAQAEARRFDAAYYSGFGKVQMDVYKDFSEIFGKYGDTA